MQEKIVSIHHLRGIAALLVVFFHFRFYLNGVYAQSDLGYLLFGGGAFGVDLFFMISGFIIAASTQRKVTVASFITRRFFRIYPAFLAVFLIGAFTVYSSEPLSVLLRSMFFIHKDYTQVSPGFGYNLLGPAWTLTYELYFYALFVLAIWINQAHRIFITSILIVFPFVAVQLAYSGTVSIAGNASPNIPSDSSFYSILRFIGSPIILEFILGMFLYYLYSNVKFKVKKEQAKFVLLICIGVALSFYFKKQHSGFGLQDFGLWSFILLFGCLFYEKSHALKENKTLSFLGDISYSLYISHYLITYTLEIYKHEILLEFNGISRFILVATACIVAATILHYVVERPFIKVGKVIDNFVKTKYCSAKIAS
ncbi:acyltransferase family protein [Hafnia paralvei]|uniref:acyltransferase family protein n=1 Tax=Hafnia paralvei TaxID=546367 RepID=UPI00141A3468|nr:acyltransferase [Hafnia paralvei]NIH31470.1 acyltransferase [Hafnia paralvei]